MPRFFYRVRDDEDAIRTGEIEATSIEAATRILGERRDIELLDIAYAGVPLEGLGSPISPRAAAMEPDFLTRPRGAVGGGMMPLGAPIVSTPVTPIPLGQPLPLGTPVPPPTLSEHSLGLQQPLSSPIAELSSGPEEPPPSYPPAGVALGQPRPVLDVPVANPPAGLALTQPRPAPDSPPIPHSPAAPRTGRLTHALSTPTPAPPVRLPPPLSQTPAPGKPDSKPIAGAQTTKSKLKRKIPNGRSQAVFFRSLATMMAAGLPIAKSLWILSDGSPEPMKAVLEEMAKNLERGRSLSAACREVDVFPTTALSSIRVGEKTGRLLHCLNKIADLTESSQKRREELQAAVIYPSCVLLVCLIFLTVAPAVVLPSLIKLLQDLHTDLPWGSKILIIAYEWFGHPKGWLLLGAVLGGWFSQAKLRAATLTTLTRLGLLWTPIRRMWTAYQMSQWCQVMALQVDSGLILTESLNSAAQASGDGELAHRTYRLKEALIQGEEFWSSLQSLGFPTLTVDLVRIGEESGQMPRALRWLGEHYETDFKTCLEVLAQLLEPLVICILGFLTGALVLMTLQPMARAIENL